jgi:hypothetical protein
MKRQWGRFLGEFLVIVVGVLVALAVDDWRDYRTDRQLEAHLLERLTDDLTADAADLALAKLVLLRRDWLFSEINAALATGRALRVIPDSIARIDEIQASVAAAGRLENIAAAGPWTDVVRYPLFGMTFTPEFDQADDAFQEMVVGGTLRTLRNPALRSQILAYYRTSRDMAANVMTGDEYSREWIDLLLDEGVAEGDGITLSRLVQIVSRNERLATHARYSANRTASQAGFLLQIEESMDALELTLAQERQR